MAILLSTMPATTLKTPPNRSCRSPSSQAVGETVTNNAAPGEAARSRHRQPPVTIAAPCPLRGQALRSSAVVGISPPSQTMPTTTLKRSPTAL